MLERKMSSEPEPELNLDEMDLDSMMAGDGSLPGGMTPDQVKKMASNPEMLKMMANPKLQEVMKVSTNVRWHMAIGCQWPSGASASRDAGSGSSEG